MKVCHALTVKCRQCGANYHVCFWREKFEGEVWLLAQNFELVDDLHCDGDSFLRLEVLVRRYHEKTSHQPVLGNKCRELANEWRSSDLAFGLHYQPSLNDSKVSLKCIGQLNKFTSVFLSLHMKGDE